MTKIHRPAPAGNAPDSAYKAFLLRYELELLRARYDSGAITPAVFSTIKASGRMLQLNKSSVGNLMQEFGSTAPTGSADPSCSSTSN
jgi:hypothetical protein